MTRGLGRVEVRGVGKLFGQVAALRGVDLDLEPGGAILVVGPNGAGKSTLLAILSTLVRPTTGRVLYDGKPAAELGASLRARIGLAAETPGAYAELTGRENLLLRARLSRVDRAAGRVATLVDELGLGAVADRPVAGYSQGERRRLGIAAALVHEPSLLLLDEPSSGLDGAGSARLVALLRSRIEAGAVVALSTHDPWLGAALGGRVLGMARGRVHLDQPAPEGEAAFGALLDRGVEG